ncbi:MAG: aminopeptidase P family protein [Acidobacteria bacterium]|nr:aminopeptidase P family protein [Acidobacteriota bacterium]
MTQFLAALDVSRRVVAARAQMAESDIAAMLVTNPTNVRYLCGFSGSNGVLLLTADEEVLITDERYRLRATEEMSAVFSNAEVVVTRPTAEVETIRQVTGAAIALDGSHLSYDQYLRMADGLGEVIASPVAIESIRRIKDDAEIERITRAAQITDQAFAAVIGMLDDEPAERDVALELDYRVRRLGADDVGYEPIVAAGPNAAIPHHESGGRRVVAGDVVIIDVGACVDGYRSDMTRTVALGSAQTEWNTRYQLVAEAQQRGVDVVRAGVNAALVDAACRSHIDDGGYGAAFLHGTGHGVGLDIHEAPAIAERSVDQLLAGDIMTVEPGIYLEGDGGVRVEDTVLVTTDGATTLTRTPKRFTIGD